jgi:HK97 family phage portal protein
MRSLIGELAGAARRGATAVLNKAPVPYVAGRNYSGAGAAVSPMDQTAQLEAPGSNGTLFAIINVLATTTAAVGWHMHRTTNVRAGTTCDECEEPGVRYVPKHPALSVWNEPNEHFTSRLFVETFQQHQDLVGEAWWVVAKLMGRPAELWPVRPDRMAPVRDPNEYLTGYVYRAPDGTLVPLGKDEVVPMRTPAPWDSYRGAGAVQTLLNNLYGAKYAAEWNRKFFENSALPGGIIEMPVHLSDPQFNEFQARFAETHKGVSNAHTVGILEHGATWKDVRYTQKDMEFAELRRVNREEIREAFAVHGHVLGLSETVNRANAEAADVSFARRLSVPRLDRIKDALDGPFLRMFGDMGKGYKFHYTNPEPEDREGNNAERTSKATAFKTLIDAGVNPDDAAAVCGLPPMRVTKPKPVAPPPMRPEAEPGEPEEGR